MKSLASTQQITCVVINSFGPYSRFRPKQWTKWELTVNVREVIKWIIASCSLRSTWFQLSNALNHSYDYIFCQRVFGTALGLCENILLFLNSKLCTKLNALPSLTTKCRARRSNERLLFKANNFSSSSLSRLCSCLASSSAPAWPCCPPASSSSGPLASSVVTSPRPFLSEVGLYLAC